MAPGTSAGSRGPACSLPLTAAAALLFGDGALFVAAVRPNSHHSRAEEGAHALRHIHLHGARIDSPPSPSSSSSSSSSSFVPAEAGLLSSYLESQQWRRSNGSAEPGQSAEDHLKKLKHRFDMLPASLSPEDPSLFYVYPSDHRSLIRPPQPFTLTILLSLRAAVQTLTLALPIGYKPRRSAADNGGTKESGSSGSGSSSGSTSGGSTSGGSTSGGSGSSGSTSSGVAASGPSSCSFEAGGAETVGSLTADPIADHIQKCEMSTATDMTEPQLLRFHLQQGIAGLSAEESVGEEPQARKVWYLKVPVDPPRESPGKEDNVFALTWKTRASEAWDGRTTYQAPPLLGDWDCVYSDWEGWEHCSARCGGGVTTLRRRVLMEPPAGGSGLVCRESLTTTVACNTHPCDWPCKDEGWLATEEEPAKCTARCGGGVRVKHRKLTGDHCLQKEEQFRDIHSVELEPCNEQPCKLSCRHTAYWRAATECSELCGKGFFWMIREVMQKDPEDEECVPLWRKQDCVKQGCSALTIVHPSRNVIPMCDRTYIVAIVIDGSQLDHYKDLNEPQEVVSKLTLTAPKGFSFGAANSDCEIFEHDLPGTPECKVTADPNTMTLTMSPKLDMPTKRQFFVELDHPPCRQDSATPDETLTLITQVPDTENRWILVLEQDNGDTTSQVALGYELLFPEEVNPETYLAQDWSSCTGRITLAIDKNTQDLCVDKPEHGSGGIVLRKCHGDTDKMRWMTPPTGDGNIVYVDNRMTQCICAADGEPGIGTKLEFDDCNRRQCRWVMPTERQGDIQLDSDSTLCITVVGGPAEEGGELGLGPCNQPSFQPLVQWETPCPSAPELRNYVLPPQSGSGVVMRREPPTYCSVRRKCPEGYQCNAEEGVCEQK